METPSATVQACAQAGCLAPLQQHKIVIEDDDNDEPHAQDPLLTAILPSLSQDKSCPTLGKHPREDKTDKPNKKPKKEGPTKIRAKSWGPCTINCPLDDGTAIDQEGPVFNLEELQRCNPGLIACTYQREIGAGGKVRCYTH